MKKLLSVFAVAVFALVLTGCGKGNTLKCSIEEAGMKLETEITFSGDKATKAVLTTDLGSKEYAEAFASIYDGQEGFSAKVKGTKVVITVSGDAMSKEVPSGSKADVKKSLEDSGYKCN